MVSKTPFSSGTRGIPAADNHPLRDEAEDLRGDGHLKSRVIKRSLVVGGHKTSVSLEDVFWHELRAIAHERHLPLSQLVGSIDAGRQHCNLSSAIRVFVFENRCNPDLDPGKQSGSLNDNAGSLAQRR